MLTKKHILLGITGGIAAYKIPFLIRLLKKRNAEVKVVMTSSAAKFVTPETLATLCGNEVIVDIFPPEGPRITTDPWHIRLGSWADVMILAPATANTIAKIAHGYADNAVTMLILALRCPLLISPAMDVDMWHHPSTRSNMNRLDEMGYTIIQPEIGELASGLVGEGRMPEVEKLLMEIEKLVRNQQRDLLHKKILVTAGPTYEALDPVRFIGNRSSGKMGFALARAAAARGASVTLISGPVHLVTPRNVQRFDVESAEQMYQAVMKHRKRQDAIIMAAAVADYAPAQVATHKISKETMSKGWYAVLQRTPDILKTLGEKKDKTILVGFALETTNDLKNAAAKLKNKNLDFIVLNNALEDGAGFGTDTNIVSLISRNGKVERLPKMSKFDVANIILNKISSLF